MDTKAQVNKSPLPFLIVLVVISLPFWLLDFFTEPSLPEDVVLNLPVSALMFICPVVAASILSYRETGWDGVKQLLKRAVDFRRINDKRWYLPVIFLMPVLMLVEYAWMKLTRDSLPDFQLTPLTLLIFFVVFIISALGEELGWSGYALDRTQTTGNAARVRLVLAIAYVLWHLIPFIQTGNSPAWVLWQSAFTLANRVLIAWLYNKTGKSVFAVSLFHAMYNLCFLILFPVYGSYYDPFMTFVLTALVAIFVTVFWGSKNLSTMPIPK
jgi:uncharacterized protein